MTQQLFQYISNNKSLGHGATFDVSSPRTGEILASGNYSSKQDLNEAIIHATVAQESWGNLAIHARCEVMFSIRHEMLMALDELSSIISMESGKTINEAKAGLLNGIEIIEYASALKNLDLGAKQLVTRNVSCESLREPLGVVAGITPFNFPAMVPLWMIPLALGVGNAFIWKPSEKTPMTALRMAEIFSKAGLPSGLLNVVHGGVDMVHDIIDHPSVKAIAFVGSTPVAKSIYSRASNANKRVLALGGAKNHIILLDDADFDLSVNTIVDSFTGCAGQRCMAASVILAVGDVQKHIDRIVHAAQEKKCGEQVGAIIDKNSLDRLHQAIEKSDKEGCKILLDGRNPSVSAKMNNGTWLGPTIIDHVKEDSFLEATELFGPILIIIRCKDIDHALEIEAKSPFGNAASVFTQSGARASYVSQKVKSAMVGINIGLPVPRPPFSFGGMNDSKFGVTDITGEQALCFWSQLKKITSRWSV